MTEHDEQQQTHQQFKHDDAGSYDNVVSHFDRYTRQFTAHLPATILKLADVPPAGTVLDVGTGTGILALQGASLNRDISFVGIDLSDGMLKQAAVNAVAEGIQSRIEFQKMDAENLLFPDACFDAVVSLYALHHFPEPAKALQEMFRVLKPGAKIVVAVGSAPSLFSIDGAKAALRKAGSIWRSVRGRELTACGFIDGLVEKYLPAGPARDVTEWVYNKKAFNGSVSDLMATTGFTHLQASWKGQYSRIESSEDFWLLQMTFSSTARKRVQQADKTKLDDLKTDFYRQCDQVLKKNGRLVYQTGAAIVCGVKPVGGSE